VLNLSNRIEKIHEKGFNMSAPRRTPDNDKVLPEMDYSRLKVGIKSLDDAIINLGSYKKLNPNMTKENIQRAIAGGEIEKMREASEFYFKVSGIYSRLCKHLANLYRYDWTISLGSMSSCSISISASHPQITIDVRIIMKKELIIL
jgi:hypothetical protein